jgi:hypothetical protein
MPYELAVAIRNNVAITASTWTDIGGPAAGAFSIPISCNLIVVVNTASVPITLATDPGNSYSTVTIPPGASWALGNSAWSPVLGGPPSGCRFSPRSANAAGSLQSTSGNQTVTLEFVL